MDGGGCWQARGTEDNTLLQGAGLQPGTDLASGCQRSHHPGNRGVTGIKRGAKRGINFETRLDHIFTNVLGREGVGVSACSSSSCTPSPLPPPLGSLQLFRFLPLLLLPLLLPFLQLCSCRRCSSLMLDALQEAVGDARAAATVSKRIGRGFRQRCSESFEAMLQMMNEKARIVLSGAILQYDRTPEQRYRHQEHVHISDQIVAKQLKTEASSSHSLLQKKRPVMTRWSPGFGKARSKRLHVCGRVQKHAAGHSQPVYRRQHWQMPCAGSAHRHLGKTRHKQVASAQARSQAGWPRQESICEPLERTLLPVRVQGNARGQSVPMTVPPVESDTADVPWVNEWFLTSIIALTVRSTH